MVDLCHDDDHQCVIGFLGSSVEESGEYPSDPGGKVTPLCKRLGLP